ncbi:Phosphoribosylformylglycinamidine synthase 1 [Rickettsiales bacterium Ac37b]|nr:Phosphoribosylformylglycinamidine synthase 1 [Rickettsiales bacterium Ac37b]
MKVGIIVFPGSNCDHDVFKVFGSYSGCFPQKIWHNDIFLPKGLDLIILPGGFSYGDYLRTGAIAANSPIIQEVIKEAEKGVYILGICNGFQILTETRLLPGTLIRNKHLKFISKSVYLRVNKTKSLYTEAYKDHPVIKIPIAHQEGCYFTDQETLRKLIDQELIAFSYSDERGVVNEESNINGSLNNIAGIINAKGNILGLMPHPERAVDILTGSEDGKYLFNYLSKELR